MKQILNSNSNCVDVGAHLGSFTHSIFQLAPKGKHSIIEAIPYKASWLCKRFPKATVHHCAVSDSEGEISFFENLDRPGFSSLTERRSTGRQKEYKVKLSTLDSILDGQKVDFIKIDVEGHELEAVKGAKGLLESQHPIVMFEAGAIYDHDIDNAKYIELFSLWGVLNYDVYAIFDFYYKRPPLTAEAFQSYRSYPFLAFNFLAFPSELRSKTIS